MIISRTAIAHKSYNTKHANARRLVHGRPISCTLRQYHAYVEQVPTAAPAHSCRNIPTLYSVL